MRVLVGSLIVAGAVLLLSPGTAIAAPSDDPVDLGGAYVLDASGVLGGDAGEVRDAVDRLYDEAGAKVFIVYVDGFDNPEDAQDWATQSATRSGLGAADLLLAVATQDRNYGVAIGTDFPLSDGDIDRAIDDALIPALRDDDWAGGGVAFADSLLQSSKPSPVPGIVAGVAGAGVVGGIVIGVARSRLKKRTARRAQEAEATALDQRAARMLVQLDDALKTSEQELGFAQAQFGEAQTKDFATALDRAKALAKQAFEVQQKLDDAFPETPEDHRALTEQLIQLTQQADEVLDAQQSAFDELRQLEKNAPEVLDRVEAQQDGLGERIDDAEKTIAALKKAHPDGDLSSLAGLPAQARKLDRFADKTVADARAAIAASKRTKAPDAPKVAVAVRAAQQAVGQVEQLLASVDRIRGELEAKAKQDAAAVAALDAQLRDARSRVQEADDYISTHRGAIGTTARTRASEASRHLGAASSAVASAPDTALSEAREAERLAAIALDLALADVENAEDALSSSQNQGYIQQDSGFDGAFMGGILGSLFGDGDGSASSSSGSSWWGGGSPGGSSSWSSSGWGGGSSHHSGGGSIFGGSGGSFGGGSHSSGGFSRRGGRSGRF
jgi:hypothetical protein